MYSLSIDEPFNLQKDAHNLPHIRTINIYLNSTLDEKLFPSFSLIYHDGQSYQFPISRIAELLNGTLTPITQKTTPRNNTISEYTKGQIADLLGAILSIEQPAVGTIMQSKRESQTGKEYVYTGPQDKTVFLVPLPEAGEKPLLLWDAKGGYYLSTANHLSFSARCPSQENLFQRLTKPQVLSKL